MWLTPKRQGFWNPKGMWIKLVSPSRFRVNSTKFLFNGVNSYCNLFLLTSIQKKYVVILTSFEILQDSMLSIWHYKEKGPMLLHSSKWNKLMNVASTCLQIQRHAQSLCVIRNKYVQVWLLIWVSCLFYLFASQIKSCRNQDYCFHYQGHNQNVEITNYGSFTWMCYTSITPSFCLSLP
jgi:hypothetical protein